MTLKEEKDKRDRAKLIQTLQSHWELTSEEATRFVDEKHPFEMENGPCRKCHGRGVVDGPMGCFGPKGFEKCRNCHDRNSGSTMRLRLPWAPHGPVVPFT